MNVGHGHDHGHGQGHGHDHDHRATARRAGERHAGRLAAAFCLIAGVLVVELVVGLAVDSLALLSDAGHMATDAIGLGMALAAVHLATRGGNRSGRSFGLYRLEILAALTNAVLLVGVAVYVTIEAIGRFASSPGMVSETFDLVRASDLVKTGEGGGVENERITVHRVPLGEVAQFAAAKRNQGFVIDVKLLLLLGSSILGDQT